MQFSITVRWLITTMALQINYLFISDLSKSDDKKEEKKGQ
jgi:hypothetical protein